MWVQKSRIGKPKRNGLEAISPHMDMGFQSGPNCTKMSALAYGIPCETSFQVQCQGESACKRIGSTSQPASQPACQSCLSIAAACTNQRISRPASQPASHPIIQAASQPASQPANQPGSQAASPPTNQPASQVTPKRENCNP